MQILHIDLETFSVLDIKQVGLYKYAENCQILLCAFAFDDQPVGIIDLASGEKFPADFLDALFDPNILKTAYNAPFEFNVLAHHLHRPLIVEQWTCTMVLGLTLGLPAGLDLLGNVLHLSSDNKKTAEGKKLINFFSSPLKSKDDTQLSLFLSTESNRNLPQFHSEKWIAFKEYCKQDVIAERAIHNHLIKFAPPVSEHKLWCLDQKINSFGVLIDLNFVKGALAIDSYIQNDARQQSQLLTAGLNLNSNFQLLNWIEQQIGWRPTSLDKNSRTLLREKNLSANIRQLLDLKEAVSKTSVKKYQAMLDTICADGRARGMFQFYGANRTGRWAGRLIQLQNLPQIHISDLTSARLFVAKKDIESLQLFSAILLTFYPNSFVPLLLLLKVTDSLSLIFPPLKLASSLGLLMKNGVWTFLLMVATFTALPLPKCSKFPLKNTASIMNSAPKVKSLNLPVVLTAALMLSKLSARIILVYLIPIWFPLSRNGETPAPISAISGAMLNPPLFLLLNLNRQPLVKKVSPFKRLTIFCLSNFPPAESLLTLTSYHQKRRQRGFGLRR